MLMGRSAATGGLATAAPTTAAVAQPLEASANEHTKTYLLHASPMAATKQLTCPSSHPRFDPLAACRDARLTAPCEREFTKTHGTLRRPWPSTPWSGTSSAPSC